MEEVIAKMDVICIRRSGERLPVTIEIGKPYEVRDGKGTDCARCPVAMRGLHEKLPDVYGEDTFQALTLALALTRNMLEYFVKDGGKVCFSEDGETEFDLKLYFAHQEK